eukprot:COSAG02_NODE_597_length_19775_cov_28.914312_17_plen_317_part_00
MPGGSAVAVMLMAGLVEVVGQCPPPPSVLPTTTEELVEWAARSDYLARWAPLLREEEIDIKTLTSASDDSLRSAGFKLGAMTRLRECASVLVSQKPISQRPTIQPPDARRQLQQQSGEPLPPPSGTCPDVTGLQQALDAATARISALEVYTDVSAAPRGLISMWSGTVDAIPHGWALCDGANGTPDLRGKFVVGANDRYALGSSVDAGENVGASVSRCTAIPAQHSYIYQYGLLTRDTTESDCNDDLRNDVTRAVMSVDAGDPVPAHYALAYIMRLDVECCVCFCSDANPTQPVSVVVPPDTAPDAACSTRAHCVQ